LNEFYLLLKIIFNLETLNISTLTNLKSLWK